MERFPNIKKGDTVAVFRGDRWTYPTVDRVGGTWFRAGGVSFRKDTGSECRNVLRPLRAEFDTPAAREDHERRRLLLAIFRALPSNPWGECHLSVPKLSAALAALTGAPEQPK